MAKGTLRCIGSSIHLKNKFGAGYRVNTISTSPTILEAELKKRWPSIKLAESEAGSLQFEYYYFADLIFPNYVQPPQLDEGQGSGYTQFF